MPTSWRIPSRGWSCPRSNSPIEKPNASSIEMLSRNLSPESCMRTLRKRGEVPERIGRAAHRHGGKNCRSRVESGFYLWQRQSVSRLRARRTFESLSAVIASAPLQLPAHDKLDVLRYLDEFHFWNSLDDERRCQRCGHTITGRQILVFELHGTRGAMRLQCPTPGCVSKPGDWMYANPVQAARLRAEAEATDLAIHDSEHSNKIQAKRSAPSHRVRDAIAHFAFLRPFATRLHAIRPVA